MKRIFLTTTAAFFTFLMAQAQGFYFSGGPNFSFVNIGNLDFVVDRYNQNESNVIQSMGDFSYLGGVSLQMGRINHKGGTFEVSWTGRNRTQTAEFIDADGPQSTQVNIRNNMFSIAGGKHWLEDKPFKIGVLASLDMGNIKQFVRTGTTGAIEDLEYTRAAKEFQVGHTFSLNMILKPKSFPIGLMVRPYYHVQYSKENFVALNSVLNPDTYQNDPTNLNERNHHPGIIAGIVLGL